MRVLIAGLLAASMTSLAWAADKPLVSFGNGEVITHEAYQEYVGRRLDLRVMARNYWGASTALREMALTRALVLEGQQLGIPKKDAEKPDRFDDVYALSINRQLSPACEAPADEQAQRKYFESHPDAFQVPASARLVRVKLPASLQVDGEPAMAWLMVRTEAVVKRQETLQSLIDRAESLYKIEPQGDLGWSQLTGDMPIIQALNEAKAGDFVGPTREGDYAYLFFIQEKRPGRQLTWSEAKTSVARRAVTFCRDEAGKALTERMFKKYAVKFDSKALAETFNPGQQKPAPLAPASAPAGKTPAAKQ